MASDGTLKFDTLIDSSGFQKGISSIGEIAQKGLKATSDILKGSMTAIAGLGGAAIKIGSDARTSEKCPASLAFMPNAVRASVTISEVVAKSSPDAAARLMIPSIPFSISSVFHPAIAIYSNAAADSVAENFVVEPISFAFSVSFSSS